MPTSYQRTEIQSFDGDKVYSLIDTDTTKQIENIAQSIGVTPYMLLISTYYILLSKYTSQDDIVLGTPVVGRDIADLQNIIGMFVNTLALREKINSTMSFKEFVLQVKENLLNSFKYQNYPFDELVNKLQIKREIGRNPLFDTMFIYQNNGYKDIEFDGTKATIYTPHTNISKFDLSLEAIPSTDGIQLSIEYMTKLYDKGFIKKILEHYLNILNNAIKDINIKISDISMISDDEKNEILYRFNNTTTQYPKEKSVIKLFEEQVEKTPDNTAVVFEGVKLTYRELNEKANSLANYLKNRGVKEREIVSIFLDKSIESIIAILSILKCGCAYMPIDTNYPSERIDYMIKKANSKVILTTKNEKEKLLNYSNVFCIDLSIVEIYRNSIKNINTEVLSEDLAYIMYTSGSTGEPKGVMVKNKNIVRLVKNTNFIKFKEKERILQTGSIVFDACTFEIWSALLNGFELYIIKKEELLDPNLLESYLKKNKITILWITAPLFNQLSESNPKMFETARVLLTGGDVLSPKHINLVRKMCPNLMIINGYGPTENTTFSTCFTIDKDYEESIPIGYPISNSTCYVVSKDLTLLPTEVPGELLVGGDGVSKGYLNNEEQTKSKFIPNKFGEGILYKTGDLVKWNKDGSIEFIGRTDNQVKIRGFRVELGEITLKIQDFDGIKECFSIVKTVNNEKVICAYFSAKEKIDIHTLREFLKKVLPSYAIPTYLVQVKSLPINANGKVDKNKLPEPKNNNIESEVIGARNEIDTKLINILKELLNVRTISMGDSFFELGGDSLFAINLCAKIENEFNTQVHVKDILESHTIEEISDIINKNLNDKKEKIIVRAPQSEYYPISTAQKRMYFTSQVAGESSVLYNIPEGIIFEGNVNVKKLEMSIIALINRHETLRTYFEPINDTVMQKILKDVNFKLDIIQNAKYDDIHIMFDEFVKPFDLSKAPLLRARYITFTNGKSALFIDIHHIVFDGKSISIFIDELCKLYNGETLPELKITYKDYAVYENKSLESGELKEAEQYWTDKFKGEIPRLDMPTNYQRPAIQSFEGNRIDLFINNDLTKQIEKLSHALGVTPYMLLVSAYYILLSKYSSNDDIIIGTPVVGRDIADTYNLIGMFVNTLALRQQIDSKIPFKEFVLQVKENLLNSYKYQTYPFDELVSKLNIKRDTSRNPLFDTMFIYQNNGFKEIELDGIKAKYYTPDINISKFDLSVEAVPNKEGIKLSFEYAKKLFTAKFIEELSSHYINIVKEILKNINTKIKDINMFSKEEENKILNQFNETKVEYEEKKSISQAFEEQVEKTPDNVAICFGDKELTFKELNEKANSLARYLRKKGIGRNDIVGIMVSRSLEMIIGILAVIKAGGAYIPIDPAYPQDRVEYMLNNSNAKILLTQNKLNKKVDFENKVFIDLSNKDVYSYLTDNLENINIPEDLFYVIYTSGSTGRPKGVMITHKTITNFTNYCNNYVEYLKNNTYQTVLSITTVSFDIFFFETIISLQKGLKVVIANENEQLTPKLLNDLIEKYNVTITQSTPSVMQIFVNNIEEMPLLKNLKYITLAGEQLPLELVKNLHKIANAKVYNGYGPSETYYVTFTEMNDEIITIGKPIDNSQIYILDKDLKPVPIGSIGELYMSGYCVAKGYLNNEELTKKSFIENPFIPGTIMYKSGDLGKYTEDGNIICLGRVDHQIKIRGQRIELGEIESVILKYPNIKNVTVVKQTIQNRECISAYYLSDKRIVTNELRKYISHTLPRYMVPTYFIRLEDFPYTPNGKIDKKALPLPKEVLNVSDEKYVAPKTELQRKLAKIWEKVLNTSPIGINDNFFELGGDSILAMNLNIELLKITNRLNYSDIFRFPTIAEQEEKINSKEDSLMFSKIENLSDNYVYVLKNTKNKEKIKAWHPRNILLTGGTGFLGIHILQEFIENEEGKVYCIVREEPGITGKAKLYQKLNYYFGNKYDDLIGKRIFAVNRKYNKTRIWTKSG